MTCSVNLYISELAFVLYCFIFLIIIFIFWPPCAACQILVSWSRMEPAPLSVKLAVQSLSHVQLFLTPWTAAHQASLSLTVSQSWPTFMSIELGMPSNCLCPLLLLPSIFPSIRIFSKESAVRWPKYWSFSFSISPSKENSGLISFRIDWFYFLAFQGTLKNLVQHHNLKVSILWCSAFFMVQLSHSYMTTGKSGSAES